MARNNIGSVVPKRSNVKSVKRSGSGGGKRPPARKPLRHGRQFKKTRFFLKLFFGLAAIGVIIGFFLVLIYGHDLPDVDKLYEDKLQQSILIQDYHGNTVTTYGDYFTEFVQYKNLPKSLIDAVIATEDRRFFTHHGLDPRGLARAIVMNLIGHKVQGGSTITQQLAKIVFLKPERKLKRKIQEAMLAIWLEKKFTKQQIITMYLNRVYLGGGVYGVDAAAHKYFNKSAKKLTLYESAMIAGMLKAPTTYSPSNNPHLSAERTSQVLTNMVNDDKINDKQRVAALKMGTSVKVTENSPNVKYYTDYVVDEVQNLVGKVQENLIVKTTFRPDLQSLAEGSIGQTMLELSDKNNATQAAMVVMKPDGEVLAVVGGVDYNESQFNRATQAMRQPGSLFKLFVYTAAMMYGKNPDDLIDDAPISIGSWHPSNYDNKLHGTVTLREAFAHSYNLAAANLSRQTGLDNIIFIARKMGIKSKLEKVPSLALGSSEVTLLEMTGAFAHIANEGRAMQPYSVEEIKTQNGRVLYRHENNGDAQIIDEATLHKMNDLLKAVVTQGTARSAQIGRDVGGKTGTSQDFHDAWFVGFTPQLVAGVWVGNDDNDAMKKVTGGSIPAKIWAGFMRPALKNTPTKSIPSEPVGFSDEVGHDIGSGVQSLWDSIVGQ